MCGIVGEIGPGSCGEEQLVRMMGMLTHRGPDEAGYLFGAGIALGHLRLSIVDLKSGQQPMSSHDGLYWIVFNGEIFNHIELRQELERCGHDFLTRSDTEVLLNSYREWGTDCFERLNGQWAFALWDRVRNIVLLSRDRWGVRPLFYSILPDGKTLVFGSEIKALLADGRISRKWDSAALKDILCCWVCEGDRTPIESIRQVPPGSYLVIKDGKHEVRTWWQLQYSPEVVEWHRSEQSWHEEVREVLADACRLRLRADVPVGAYLSGGLDSGLIAWLVKSLHQNELETFSISFSDPGYDESKYQALMAAHLGTKHHEVKITRDSISESFRDAIWHAETPIYRTAPVPMFRLSKLVHDCDFKVVLTGEGADEMFAGYDQFKEDKIRRFWSRNPSSKWRKRLLDRLEYNIPGTGPRTREFWYAFFQNGLSQTQAPGYSHRIRWRNGISLLPLLEDSHLHSNSSPDSAGRADGNAWIETMESSVPRGFDSWKPLSKAQYWECRQLLSGYLLSSQGDRMAMAHSVEGRYPFLDFRVYDLARRMPPELKLRGLVEKHVLKKAFEGKIPEQLLRRRKNPYRAPDALCFLSPSGINSFCESLSPDSVRRRGLFKPASIAKLVERLQHSHEHSARDNMAAVFAYSSHIFHDLFIESKMTPASLPPVRTRVDLNKTGHPFPGILGRLFAPSSYLHITEAET